jgi:hypothetical protein
MSIIVDNGVHALKWAWLPPPSLTANHLSEFEHELTNHLHEVAPVSSLIDLSLISILNSTSILKM